MFREKEALKFVNDTRAAVGLDPIPSLLPGSRGVCQRCPIANSVRYGSELIAACSGRSIYVWENNYAPVKYVASLDEATYTWVTAFDAGRIPEMVV